jgi:hypothetical protein
MSRIPLVVAIVGCLGGSLPARAEVPLPVLSLAVSSVTVTEGDSGQTPFTAQVSLSGSYPTTVTARVRATPGTADENDYVFSEAVAGQGVAAQR